MIPLEFGVQLITRAEWGARAARSWTAIDAQYGSTGHWEGPEMGWPWDHSSCYTKVRGIQAFHMDSRGWVDIAYSAIACGHGYLFEGRGPNKRTAANGTNTGNNTAYAVCYLGGERDGFTSEGERAMLAGFNWLQRTGAAGIRRNGHRDWKSTQCPGDEIYLWIHSGQQIDPPPTPPPTPIEDEEEDEMKPFVMWLPNNTFWNVEERAVQRIDGDMYSRYITIGYKAMAPTQGSGDALILYKQSLMQIDTESLNASMAAAELQVATELGLVSS